MKTKRMKRRRHGHRRWPVSLKVGGKVGGYRTSMSSKTLDVDYRPKSKKRC